MERKKNIVILVIGVLIVLCVAYLINGFFWTNKLFQAVKTCDYEAAKRAIEHGAWVNKREHLLYAPNLMQTNQTPLIYACRNGDEKIVELLIKSGADVNKDDNYRHVTPLREALKDSKANRFDIAWYLIENGADIHAAKDAIFIATTVYLNDNEETIQKGFVFFQYLYENGVSIETTNLQHNLLTYAAFYRNYNVVNFLLENHLFAINDVNNIKDTALITAAKSGDQKMVELLLQFGADVSITNKDQKTAYDCAIEKGYYEIAELLK